MSIKTRFGILLALLLLGFVGALRVLHALEEHEAEELLAGKREERLMVLQQWLQLSSRSLQRFTNDHARTAGLGRFLAQPDEAWARANLDPVLGGLDLRGLWILRSDGTTLGATPADAAQRAPVSTSDLAAIAAGTQSGYFFQEGDSGISEVAVSAIPPVADAAAGGWLVAQRRWDETRVAELASITGGRVRLAPADATGLAAHESKEVFLERVLTDSSGRALRKLQVSFDSEELAAALETDAREATAFIVFGFLTFVVLIVSLHTWVIRPLNRLSASLAQLDPAPIAGMSAHPHEFGRMAQLVESSFQQRDALKREVAERERVAEALRRSEAALKETLAERERLGRDLHDGVIQSLYAAGMGLTSIRELLQPGQAAVAARIDQTRNALNETISDVRNFITGLEPEALKQRTFRQAISALIEYLQSTSPARAHIAIDESLAERLTLDQRVHALLIAREGVSNAVRHGGASEVRLTLRGVAGQIEFEIADDGRGFVPSPDSPGLGLGNLADRARELGATLAVDSEPGRGTRLTLQIPVPPTS